MGKRKAQIVEPESFDPDAPSPVSGPLPGTPEEAPSYPGDNDDADDETENENEAVPDEGTEPDSIAVDVEIENHDARRDRLSEQIDDTDDEEADDSR
ncbi:hypothetical protein [Hyphomicrobium sp.]|uniref:hypothetical protein n=1 Tax=Hyphomicrobium sp. TaxID=82 RepID=UPI002D7812B8|nr:hypothetical protein [Hyphomicrobium sp.]HET6390684.1 hypothetical protein [Hyphomicrobium sp.]